VDGYFRRSIFNKNGRFMENHPNLSDNMLSEWNPPVNWWIMKCWVYSTHIFARDFAHISGEKFNFHPRIG
jgi:hypothetical protein